MQLTLDPAEPDAEGGVHARDESHAAESLTALPPDPSLAEAEPEIDAGELIEAAEELLRENAPHDFDVLVIGGGPGGSVCAIRAALLGLRVGLVEERELGGVCLNRGCIPTKTLLESVEVLRLLRRAREYGITTSGGFAPDLHAMHARKDEVIARLRENVRRQLEKSGAQVLEGRASFVGEHVVEVKAPEGPVRRITAVHVVIATGSLPLRPPLPGIDLPGVLTSDEIFHEKEVPQVLVTIGGGAVGVEFAYLFHELGSRSILVEGDRQILPSEDDNIGREMDRLLRGYGLDVRAGRKLKSIESSAQGTRLRVTLESDNGEEVVEADRVLLALGRRANVEHLELAAAGVARDEKGAVQVDAERQTSVAGVYGIGDCIRSVGWAHQAAGEGTMVAEMLAGRVPSIDLKHLPSCYYTHPEIASVGLTLQQARGEGKAARVGRFDFRSNGRAASAGEHEGFVQLVVEDGSEKLLGCQIIGPRATELINEVVVALKNGSTVEQFVGAVHAHPTFAEALPEAALQALASGGNLGGQRGGSIIEEAEKDDLATDDEGREGDYQ